MGDSPGAETGPPLFNTTEKIETRLHSRYNPQAEAERYVDALDLGGGIEYFILIEPGMGYLISALRSRYRQSVIIVLHADSRFRGMAAESPDTPVWYPDSGETIQGFLEPLIPDTGAASARIIEWRPSLRLYGEACLRLVAEAAAFIKRADASHRTAAAFGKRWVRNFFKNAALLQTALRFKPITQPLIITGAGPSLETVLPQIRAMQNSAGILAASSSLPALAAAGIQPSLLISTDGGAWALLHLYACFRPPQRQKPRLALALSAAIPSQCAALPVLALNDGSLWQNIVLNALGIPSVIIPQRGTVTASAVDLALLLSEGPVYLAGMDLAVRDIRTHARPYGFDHLFYGAASRLRPVYSQCFTRSGETRSGGSHAVYAAWFKNQLAVWPQRIFPLGDNHAVFGGLRGALPETAAGSGGGGQGEWFSETAVSGSPAERCKKGSAALFRAMDDPRYSATLKGELAPLLFPGTGGIADGVTGSAIREAVESITARYGRNCG